MNRPSFLCRFTAPKLPAAALLVASLWLHASLLALPGDLDPSFNGTGKLRLSFSPGDDGGTAAAVQADGKLIVAGFIGNGSNTDFAVIRYHADGTPDSTFGSGGVVRTRVGASGWAAAIVILDDGKIVVAGNAAGFANSSDSDFALVRYHPDGSLDTSFGNGGIVMTPLSPSADFCEAMALQPDGKIILAGSTPYFSGAITDEFNFALVRYNADGALDASFDGDGVLITQLTPGDDICSAVIVQPDGRIVAGGHAPVSATDVDFALVRYLPDGALDSSFGDDGMITTSVSTSYDEASALAFQPGIASAALPDKIVAVGYSSGPEKGVVVVRYRMDGSPDSSFGGDGIVHTPIGAGAEGASAVLIQAIGNQPREIVVAGFAVDSSTETSGFALARYLDDGSLDASFDGDGKLLTKIGSSGDSCATIAFQTDKIVAAGYTYTEGQSDIAIVRYNSDGALDRTFDGDGIRTEDFGTHPAMGRFVALQSDGKIVLAGSDFDHGIALARCNADGSMDGSFGSGGKLTVMPFGTMSFLDGWLIQPDGRFVIASSFYGGFDLSFALARLHADGSPDLSFSGDGKLTTAVGSDLSDANALLLQPDGKIVAAGSARVRDTPLDEPSHVFAVVRYRSDGSLDNTFDGNGIATTLVGEDAYGYAAALQTDGKIIAGGSSSGNSAVSFALVRYSPNGAPDAAFGSSGKVVTTMGSLSVCQAVKIQTDDKILAAGYSLNTTTGIDFALVRYNSDGSLDTSFGGTGKVITPISNEDDRIQSLVIQDDGRIVVCGTGYGGPDSFTDYFLVRYNPDGSLDTGFGSGGIVRIDINGDDTANDVAMDASGNFIVTGNSGGFFGVARVRGGTLPNEPPVVNILSPTQGEVLAVGENVRFAVSVADQTTLAAPVVEFFLDGQSAGVDATGPYTLDWIATQGAHVLSISATDSFGLTTQTTGRLFFAAAPIIASNGQWKYLSGWFDPGATWRATNYDDGWWDSGQAELGFGDGDEITVLPPEDRFQWAPTYYFRRRFFVPNTATANYATAHLLRDDGAAVYLNGQRIGLFNLPELYDNETPALENLPDRAGKEEAEDSFALPPELVTPGENILAVEVHQAVEFPRNQYDLSFALSLAFFSYDAGQVLTSTVIDGKMTLRWPDYLPDWNLQRSVDLATWETVSAGAVVSGAWFTFEVPSDGPAKREFFRLRKVLP